LQVVGAESAQQQFSLVEPRGMGRGEEQPDMGVGVPQEVACRLSDMAGAVVPNEVDASRSPMFAE
jgi:hypothetical protein